MSVLQIIILIAGVIYLGLLTSSDPRTRFLGHCVVVLIQPAWFYETWINDQFGMFILAVCYFIIGFKGMFTTWNEMKLHALRNPR